jgi:hypothetical protein
MTRAGIVSTPAQSEGATLTAGQTLASPHPEERSLRTQRSEGRVQLISIAIIH